ncbi:3-hydroxyacyl-CoA dehydrogenase NAD-binding domain-containing protein [Caldovatus aquaticus]|uniref:Enoyl-CoA hydratase/isomerase family protein n=1 Tax=Caldovatus aquaticus TaxID=2865671 RepID=A0ABS7F3H8_9PROT|nr:3-hydroxyacyl-CoA dehydrogenase NAD-binding domain-containing protein [Caldovatus aquaticus]MBW8270161.1 enoyl-CoA hydratase/isomerase family protein [Caldovatus aquaticus]
MQQQDEAHYVQHAAEGDIHILRLANPPVNTLRAALRAELVAGLNAAREAGAKAVVIVGTGRMFSAGAEMTEFGKPRVPPGLHDIAEEIARFPGPVVAGIHGGAYGGGLELALACHARVAAKGTKLALPEVKRGILPGGGGTQRMPRLIGPIPALRMIVSGEPVTAEEALKLGFVDEVAEGDIEAAAVAFARRALAEGHRFVLARDRTDKTAGADLAAFDAEVEALLRRSRGMLAPVNCAKSVRAALTEPFDQGLQTERALFNELVNSEQSLALRHIFFAEREAQKVPGVPPGTPTVKVAKAAVIGAGTMGGGIAMCFAAAGIPVTVVEADAEALQKGIERCAANWRRSRNAPPEEEIRRRLSLMTGTTDMAAVGDADLVIEAVFEDIGVKEKVFAELDRHARPGAILASNTSTLDIDRIARATRRPRDVLGMHFFSPANIMRLLEIVRGRETSPEAIATAMEVGKAIGKVPVVVGNCDGFVGNRMTGKRGPQIEKLLAEGCLPQDIDRVMESYGMAMGPLATGDLAGLDIGAAVRRARGTVAPIADALVAAGRYGQKTGKGWYRYDENRRRHPDPEVERIILETSQRLGITRRRISDEEILDRLLLPMVNEGARILEEGIATRASDIDVVFVHGFGWPAWRGGPMFWADRVGLKEVRDRLARYAAATNDPNLQPAPLIERLAAEGGSFAGLDRARSPAAAAG